MNLDVNLLPKSSKKLGGFDAFLLFIIIVGVLLIIAFFGFYTPINNKTTLENQIEDRKQELTIVTAKTKEYTDLVNRVSAQTDRNKTIVSLKDNYILQSAVLEDIELSLHRDIILTNISLTQSSIDIKGESNDYDTIAQSIVNLREKDYFVGGSFKSVELDSEELYTFDMSISVENPEIHEVIDEDDIEGNEEEVEDTDETE
ncbi:MAG TPA: PilN domain-containing protein [Bacillota bacterium]|nr:PilN domain-containing protein [Bacillota bacterium]